MFGRKRILGHSHPILVSIAIGVCVLYQHPAWAATVACIRNVTGNLLHNGVVPLGAATSSCAVGSVWPQVAPVQMQPSGSTPDGYMYLAFNTVTNHLFVGVDVGSDQDLSDQDSVALIFDADNSNSFTNGDFFIQVKAIADPTPIPGGPPYCSETTGTVTQPTGEVTYFQFDGTWGEVTGSDLDAIRAAVNTKIAYRYDVSPPVWNMEIDLPTALTVGSKTYFNLNTAGFGMGAYYFVDKQHQQSPEQGTVLRWPDTLAPRDISDPVLVQLPTTKVLDPATFGDMSLGDTCLDVNFSTAIPAWEINGSPANSSDHRIQRPPANNTYSVTYHYKGPGTTQGNSPNNGTIELTLHPYTAGVQVPEWVESVQTDPAQFNKDTKVDILFRNDSPNRPSTWGSFGQDDFVCATMRLKNFTHDDDTSNDSHNVNYNYFATSDYKHQFFVSGDDLPDLRPGEKGTLFLRLESLNDPEAAKPSGPRSILGYWGGYPRWTTYGVLGLILPIGLIAVRRRSPLSPRHMCTLALLSVVTIGGCYFICPRTPMGTARWQIPNARELGLKPVKGDPTLYEMPIAKGEIKRIDLQFSGRPLPYQPVHSELRPATESGEPNIQRIPVRPGGVVTVLAFGEVDLDGPDGPLAPTSATGLVLRESSPPPPPRPSTLAAVARQGFLLQEGYYTPSQYAGALIGSFDGFEHSFVIGRNNSIVVPQGATTLSVAVNGIRGSYRAITGAFNLVVIGTELPPVPTHTVNAGDATGHVPASLDSWRVLTSLNIYTYYQKPTGDPAGGIRGLTLHPLGAAHYSIYESHM